ncbi:MAG: hypothetical protein HYR96_06660 [Deltaproteobacteria bacterium]|nr:hypothetical protein [Deltaproteobacteria bacterium]MBI3296457.1 hypothetical protein [Deltaproteobacteria bacterium]
MCCASKQKRLNPDRDLTDKTSEMHSYQPMMRLGTLLLFVAFHAHGASDVLQGPCKADVMNYCKSIKPGSGRILRCLRRNADRLSPDCKAHRENKSAEIRQRMLACQQDSEKFCKDTRPGRARIHKCLKRHEEDLSPACLAEIEKINSPPAER